MGIREKRKGKRFEHYVSTAFSTWYYDRPDVLAPTPMSGGWSAAPIGDVQVKPLVSEQVPRFPFFIECRNREKWDLIDVFTSMHTSLRAWWGETFSKAIQISKCPLLVFTKNFRAVFVAFDTVLLCEVISRYVDTMRPMILFEMDFLANTPEGAKSTKRWVNILVLEDFFQMFPMRIGGVNADVQT